MNNGRLGRQLVKTTQMKPGYIYGGTLVGEVQVDGDGNFWWKRADGKVQQIRPRENSLWHIVSKIDGE